MVHTPEVQAELDALNGTWEDQTVYIIEKEVMKVGRRGKLKGFSRWFVLETFLWIKENSRTKLADLDIDADNLVEVGFVKQIQIWASGENVVFDVCERRQGQWVRGKGVGPCLMIRGERLAGSSGVVLVFSGPLTSGQRSPSDYTGEIGSDSGTRYWHVWTYFYQAAPCHDNNLK